MKTAATGAVLAAVAWRGKVQPFSLYASQSGLAVTATFTVLRTVRAGQHLRGPDGTERVRYW